MGRGLAAPSPELIPCSRSSASNFGLRVSRLPCTPLDKLLATPLDDADNDADNDDDDDDDDDDADVCVAMILLLLFLAKRHKQATEREREKLHESRKKTQKITNSDKMLLGESIHA